jgi:hypothetical protein
MASNYPEEFMTRRDLLQSIVDLEYLSWSTRDPAKRDEYEQQLQDFRQELLRIDRQSAETYASRRYGRAA